MIKYHNGMSCIIAEMILDLKQNLDLLSLRYLVEVNMRSVVVNKENWVMKRIAEINIIELVTLQQWYLKIICDAYYCYKTMSS